MLGRQLTKGGYVGRCSIIVGIMSKNNSSNRKLSDINIGAWLLATLMVMLAGFTVLGILIFNQSSDNVRTDTPAGILLSAEERVEEIRRTYGDIGTIAHTKNFEFTASKLDCSQSTLKMQDSDEQLTSANGKFCIVGLTAKNVSEQEQAFGADDVLMRSGSLDRSSVASRVLYRPSTDAQVKIFGEQFGTIGSGETVEGELLFDLEREAIPYSIKVVDEPGESPATIYLDDWGNDGQFACRKPQPLVVNQTVEDCGVSYRLNELECEQTINVSGSEFNVCLADFTMTNISHQFREDSPYAPNFAYKGYAAFYAAFGNHQPYMVSENGNWYEQVYIYDGRISYYDEEEGEWQDIELEMPGGEEYLSHYDDYEKRSELNLEPGEPIRGILVFVVDTDVAQDSLYLDNYYYYSYIIEDVAASSADASVSSEASSSSPSSAPSSRCPTCGSREF